MKVHKEKKQLELTSIPLADYCDPEVDTACEPTCESNADLCESPALSVDEPLDEGSRAFVGATTGDEPELADCPESITGGTWIGWRGHSFIITGTLTRQRGLRSWPWGEAEYALPPGPWESTDGKATIWSGVVKGKCWGHINRYGEWEGVISFSWLRGDAQEEAGGGGGGSGWEEYEYYTVERRAFVERHGPGTHRRPRG